MNLSEEESLLLAVRNDADSDVPRLVYADWLEENDEAKRAEYIRLDIELHRTSNAKRNLWLMARINELAKELTAQWNYTIRRGFVEELTLRHRDIVDDECPVCSGVGYWAAEEYPPQEQVFCDRCESTGKNDIFQRWLGLLPLKRINVSDKAPLRIMDEDYWHLVNGKGQLRDASDLSSVVWQYMTGHSFATTKSFRHYHSPQLAHADLSQACIKLLRNKFDSYHMEVSQ